MEGKFVDFIKKNFKGTLPYNIAFKTYYGLKGGFYRYLRFRLLLPAVYDHYSKRPLKTNKVLFIEVREGSLSNDFQLLYDRLKRDYKVNIQIHYLEDYKTGKITQLFRNCNLVKDMADAKYIFISDACRPANCMTLRKGTIMFQVWHACGAFKRFGLSSADKLFGDNKQTQEKYPFHKNYTYAAVSSPEVVWAYEEAFGLKDKPGIVRPTGISRTDVFFDKDYVSSARSRVEDFFPQARGRKIILYAPTFRGRVAEAAAPDRLDIREMKLALSDKYVLLTKQHPFVQNIPPVPEGCEDFAKDCTGKLNIEDCLCAADVCITDYSSIIYEYSLFERPMIFFAYDLDDYNDWRGFFYPYEEMTPGPIYTTTGDIIDYIKSTDEHFDKSQVHAFKEKFMGSCDGHATDRILKLALGKNEKRLRKNR